MMTIGNFEVSNFPRREAEAVIHAAQGLSAKEAARIMGVSHRTVEDQLKSAIRRLEARNRVHMVSEAFIRGWIKARDTTVCLALIAGLIAGSVMDDEQWARRHTRIRRRDEVSLQVA